MYIKAYSVFLYTNILSLCLSIDIYNTINLKARNSGLHK